MSPKGKVDQSLPRDLLLVKQSQIIRYRLATVWWCINFFCVLCSSIYSYISTNKMPFCYVTMCTFSSLASNTSTIGVFYWVLCWRLVLKLFYFSWLVDADMFQFFVLFLENTIFSIRHNWSAAFCSIILIVVSAVQTMFIFPGCNIPWH